MNTPKNLIIVGLCLVIVGVVLALLFRPAAKPQIMGDLSPAQEKEIQASMVRSEARGDSLQAELTKREVKDSVEKKAHTAAVQPHKKVIKRLEKDPEVIQVRDSVPKIDSLLKAKDSVIVHHEIRIAEQELSAQVTKEINEQVHANFEKQLSDTQKLLHEKELENQQLTKANKKLKTGRVLRNVLLPVAVVGSFILGALAGD